MVADKYAHLVPATWDHVDGAFRSGYHEAWLQALLTLKSYRDLGM